MQKYDVIVIGLGPAGMAVTNMAAEMGMKVLAVESRKIGGENDNTGSVPSQALIAISENNPMMSDAFAQINADIDHLRENKIASIADKADLLLGKGFASFINENTIRVGNDQYSGRHIFVATGTRPLIPRIPGLDQVKYLTNENLFELSAIPESMAFIGGGSISCEMAQAFARMGCKCTIVHDRPYLLPNGEREASEILKESCEKMGITVYNCTLIAQIAENDKGRITIRTTEGIEIESEKLMVAVGRNYDFSSLQLENANIEYGKKGIIVDEYLRTTNKDVYAVGDCNGSFLLSHAAMHQGMLALMNTVLLAPLKKKYLKYPVPWTVYTEPQISHVGRTRMQLDADKVEYEVVETRYTDDENAVNKKEDGYIHVYVSSAGKIYGVSIVGGNAAEMINEWTLAMQHDIGFYDLMMTMHSFPTIGFLSKRLGEKWITKNTESGLLKKILKFFSPKG